MEDELQAFQALLLEVLTREPDPDRALAELRARCASPEHAAWLARLDPRMVKVAAALVARWAVRDA